jgi:hypothetical protein
MATAAIVTERRVNLNLSEAEADALAALLFRVGGNPASARKHTDRIVGALRGVGISFRCTDAQADGMVWFDLPDSNVTQLRGVAR